MIRTTAFVLAALSCGIALMLFAAALAAEPRVSLLEAAHISMALSLASISATLVGKQ